MRTNPVKEALAAGGIAYGCMCFEFFTPGLAQIAKAAGAEYILFDMEHSGAEIDVMKQQFAYCRGVGIVPMARVPAGDYHFIARALDVGAMGIMVPMVADAKQAEAIVSCTRYPPHGRRGAAFGVAHDDYEGGSVTDKMQIANERTLVMCLIETAEGVKNVDAIAAVPGVDVCWLGHFDLSNFIGIPAQFDHPKFLKAVDRITEACARHGKAAGMMAHEEPWARTFMEKGFRAMAWGLDINMVQVPLRADLATLRAEIGTAPVVPPTVKAASAKRAGDKAAKPAFAKVKPVKPAKKARKA